MTVNEHTHYQLPGVEFGREEGRVLSSRPYHLATRAVSLRSPLLGKP